MDDIKERIARVPGWGPDPVSEVLGSGSERPVRAERRPQLKQQHHLLSSEPGPALARQRGAEIARKRGQKLPLGWETRALVLLSRVEC